MLAYYVLLLVRSFTSCCISHSTSLVPRLSTRLHRKYEGRGGEKVRKSVESLGTRLLIHSAPTIEKRWSYVAVTLKTKRKSTIPIEFPGYWWLV